MLFTFDSYSITQVSPETPFFNIGGLPVLRLEFISIVFVLAFAAGGAVSLLLKDRVRNILPFGTIGIGAIMLFIGVFDVNLLQLLAPDMRISHVIMLVSQITGIAAGATGIFYGITIRKFTRTPYALAGILIGAVFAMIANAVGAYTVLYMLFGALILLAAVVLQFGVKNMPLQEVRYKLNIAFLKNFFSVGLAVFTILISYQYITVSLTMPVYIYGVLVACGVFLAAVARRSKLNIASYALIIAVTLGLTVAAAIVEDGLLICLTVIMLIACTGIDIDNEEDKLHFTGAVSGALVAAVIAYVALHFISEVVKHSNNRVIYYLSSDAWFIALGMLIAYIVAVALSYFLKRKA